MEDKLEEALELPLAGKLQRKLLLRVYQNFTVSDFIRCVDYLIDRDFAWISEKDKLAALEISRLAISSMKGNLYHSPEHAFHVAFISLLLSKDDRFRYLPPRIRFLLFLSALGHDIGHDGRMDSSGKFVMETKSANDVAKILLDMGFLTEEYGIVRSLILATCAPHRKLIMRLVDAVEMNCLCVAASHLEVPEELADLRHDESLIRASGILSDADLFFSVALGKEASFEQSERVFAEIDAKADSPSSLSVNARRQAFFRHIVTSNFASSSGSEFSPSLEQLWGEAFGQDLSLRAASFSRRARHLGGADRSDLRRELFRWSGGYQGYKSCRLMESNGHIFLVRGADALALTRSGLFLEGRMIESSFHGTTYLGVVGG